MDVSRNAGIIRADDQDKINNTVICIAGVGGDGGLIAELLARMGFGSGDKGEIRIADPDKFGPENLNRQNFANQDTIGENKATVVARELEKISPGCTANKVYTQGVTAENIDEFLNGTDIVVDETDYESHWVGVMIARAARKQRIPVFTGLNLAWGGQFTSFQPDGQTLEEFLGLSSKMNLEDIRKQPVHLGRWVAHLPVYIQYEVFRDIQNNGRPVPSVGPGVALAAGNVVTQIFRYIVGKSVITAPRVGWDDAMHHRRGTVVAPVLDFYYTASLMYLRSKLNRNRS